MARGNGTKDVQWKNTINAYKGIAAVAIAYFYHQVKYMYTPLLGSICQKRRRSGLR